MGREHARERKRRRTTAKMMRKKKEAVEVGTEHVIGKKRRRKGN